MCHLICCVPSFNCLPEKDKVSECPDVFGLISAIFFPLSLYIVIPEYSAFTGSLNVNLIVSGCFDTRPFCAGVVFSKVACAEAILSYSARIKIGTSSITL